MVVPGPLPQWSSLPVPGLLPPGTPGNGKGAATPAAVSSRSGAVSWAVRVPCLQGAWATCPTTNPSHVQPTQTLSRQLRGQGRQSSGSLPPRPLLLELGPPVQRPATPAPGPPVPRPTRLAPGPPVSWPTCPDHGLLGPRSVCPANPLGKAVNSASPHSGADVSAGSGKQTDSVLLSQPLTSLLPGTLSSTLLRGHTCSVPADLLSTVSGGVSFALLRGDTCGPSPRAGGFASVT